MPTVRPLSREVGNGKRHQGSGGFAHEIVNLHEAPACADLVRTLRVIADDIESGKHPAAHWPATTAVLILGHQSERPQNDDITVSRSDWQTHGFGPRADVFTVRGLLAAVIGKGFDSDGD